MLRPPQVAWVACGLFVLTTASLLATLDMGFTRDESFYFRYSRSYAEWFQRLEQADTPEEIGDVLSREQVVGTWRGNFEHPPLMKTAFGASWRAFGRKDRSMRVAGDGEPVEVRGLARADGFPEGASVVLLGPQAVGQEPTDPDRVVGMARVSQRQARGARLDVAGADFAAIASACARKPGDGLEPALVTGCQAREDAALHMMSESTAMRFPGVLAAALAVVLTFLLGVATVGWQAGLLGALMFLFVPRHFFHAHLCAFDMAIVAGVLATLYGFWRAQTDRRWALATGVIWGLAILIKHNALFLPVPLGLYWLWSGRRVIRLGWRGRLPRFRLPAWPVAFVTMPLLGLPMLFAFWPKLWHDPFTSLWKYLSFHLEHDHYFQWYFGQPLQVPPFPVSFPFVLTAATIAESFLVLIVLGVAFRLWSARHRDRAPGPGPSHGDATSYLLLNGLIPIVLIALPLTPIFGGVKHWMTGMPLLLLLAGEALVVVARRLRSSLGNAALGRLAATALVASVLIPPAYAAVDDVAFGSGAYNSVLVGGAPGAADKHMMRMYWGHTSRQALPWVNAHAPPRARVFFQNTTGEAVEMYKRDGLLRHDIRFHPHAAGAQMALIEPQKAFDELDIDVRSALGVAGPAHVVTFDGVPMLRVYARPPRTPRRAPPTL